MKTPEEIKKGLECCIENKGCIDCPYRGDCNELEGDALAYIQQIEQERIMLMDTVSKMCGKTPRWISVNEQLPKEFATVLIMRDDIKQACVGWLIGGHWSVPKGVRVTHWMPLPEPPKK